MHIQIPSSNSRHMGTHKNNMLYGSVEGVMTAAKTAMQNQMTRRFLRKVSVSITPMRYTNSMASGNWKEIPKITGIMMANPSHSLRRRSGSRPIHSLNHSSASIVLGMTKNSHISTPTMNRPMLNGM